MSTRIQRTVDRQYAVALKNSGAGATATGTRTSFASAGDIDWGAILGPIATGVGAGIRDRIAGGRGAPPPPSAPPPSQFAPGGTGLAGPCGPGQINVLGRCVNLAAAAPGGTPMITQAGGNAVVGAFGMPAMVPMVEVRQVRDCGPGMVLGKDNLCYPKAVLGKRNKWRKWRQPVKPPITSSDVRAIRQAARAKDRVRDLAKDVGYSVRKR